MRVKLACLLLLFSILLTSCVATSAASGEGRPEATASSTFSAMTIASSSPTDVVPETATPTVQAEDAATFVPLPSVTPSPTVTATPAVCPYLQGRTEIGTLQSSAMGEQVRFLVHLPPCYHEYPDRAFPVLYLFHGWPLNEWHWVNLGINTWRDDWVSRGLTGPFMIVMPGVGSDGRYVHSSGGDGSFEGFVVNELVPYIDGAYRTLAVPAGRAVGGISRGGVWALEIAMRRQDLFGIVGGHSPALALNRPLPQYDPFLLARQDVSGLRFYLDAGDGDWARAGTIQLRDVLLEVGADVTFQIHTGGHVDDLWSGGIPDYITFYASEWPASYALLPAWESPEVASTSAGP